MVEPAGRYTSCLRSPPVVERRPLNVSIDADHPRSLCGLRGGDRLFPSGRRRSRIPSPDGFGPPESRQVRYQVPRNRPRSDRPAIRRTVPDGLTGPPKKGARIVVRCGDGDITEQFRCIRTFSDMVNTRAAKFAAGVNRQRWGGKKHSPGRCALMCVVCYESLFLRGNNAPFPEPLSEGLLSGVFVLASRLVGQRANDPA